MNLSKMMLVPVFMLAGLATACGNDCVDGCEDKKDCADATAEQKAEDCDKACDDLEELSDSADCSDQFDDLMSCGSDIDDVCKPPENACNTEGEAFFTCITKYCTAHTDDTKCAAGG